MKKWVLTAIGAVGVASIVAALVLVFTQSSSPAGSPASPAAAGSPASPVQPASLVQVRAFGANPSKLGMYLYVPHSVRPDPAILLALHGCEGSGPDFYNDTEFSVLADEYGFIVIYPSSKWSDGCWDVSSSAALRRGGGSDPVGLMSMITYTERKYHANPRRVYVTGASSGGMMTAVMLGDYPDVFQAGAIFMGVPFGCFAGPVPDYFSIACVAGQVTMTPQRWGDQVRAADPGYHGPRPRVQIWHGTADDTVSYADFGQEIKQWTNVLGVSQRPLVTDSPHAGWTRTMYGTSRSDIQIEAYSILEASHDLPQTGMEPYVIQFFGLDRA